MTIEVTNSRMDYTGNGSTATYAYTFPIYQDSDLLVTKRDTSGNETTLVLTTDYTVTGAGESAGGTITLVAGNLTSGYHLTIQRVRPLTQSTAFRNQQTFYPENHETTFDNQVMVDQQQQDLIDRSVKLPATVSASVFDPTLPAEIIDSGSAGKAIAVNDTYDGLQMGPSLGDIANAAANAAAAAASAAAAATSETNAATSATAAASSASSAASSVAAILFNSVVKKATADSPITLTNSDRGKFYEIDSSAGDVTINLPSIATLTTPWTIAIKKEDAGAHTITIARASTDTIDGATSTTLTVSGSGYVFVPNTTSSPKNYDTMYFGAGTTPADNSVTTAKIVDLAVTTAKINDLAVTTGKLAAGAVTLANLATAFFPSGAVHLDTGNGHGSTNTKIRRFANIRQNDSDAITYADSSTDGASFTVSENGLYFIEYCEYAPSGNPTTTVFGISLNSAVLTTNISSVTYAQGKRAISQVLVGNNVYGSIGLMIYLAANDVIRPHTDTTGSPSESSNTIFRMSEILRMP